MQRSEKQLYISARSAGHLLLESSHGTTHAVRGRRLRPALLVSGGCGRAAAGRNHEVVSDLVDRTADNGVMLI